jgi:hypothetical protein
VFDSACCPHIRFLDVTRRHSDTDMKALYPLVQNRWDFCCACCGLEGRDSGVKNEGRSQQLQVHGARNAGMALTCQIWLNGMIY